MSSPMERLKALLSKEYPRLELVLTKPLRADGVWGLDVRGKRPISVDWQKAKGFGVTTPDPDDYTTTSDEVYFTVPATFQRLSELIQSGKPTVPARGLRLADFRKLCNVSQIELAERLGVSQANITQMERREDIKLSTIARTFEALGIELKIEATLPNGEVRQILI